MDFGELKFGEIRNGLEMNEFAAATRDDWCNVGVTLSNWWVGPPSVCKQKGLMGCIAIGLISKQVTLVA